MNEAELIQRAKNGSRSAFDELIIKQDLGKLYGYTYTVMHDHHNTEDVVQIALQKAWCSIHTFDAARSSFKTWLHTICRNVSFNWFRGEARRIKAMENLFEWEPGCWQGGVAAHASSNRVLEGILLEEGEVLIRNATQRLPERAQEVLRLYLVGYKQREIAAKMGIQEGTVASTLNRAKKAIKGELECTH